MKQFTICLKLLRWLIPAWFAVAVPSLAYAHVGVDSASGWMHGFTHPVGGADHLLAMLAVGVWAAQMGGRALWRVPLTFVAVMALGAWTGATIVPFGYAEPGITLSLLILGVLIAAAIRLPLAVSAALVGVFALCHGYAHGTEMPQNISGLAYTAGFMLATALLHLAGIGLAQIAQVTDRKQWLRLAGFFIALCGGGLLFAG